MLKIGKLVEKRKKLKEANKDFGVILVNSEFLLMLSQAPTDRGEFAKLLSISDTQMSYITDSGSGKGLVKDGKPSCRL